MYLLESLLCHLQVKYPGGEGWGNGGVGGEVEDSSC
jgi:hypothetical protein